MSGSLGVCPSWGGRPFVRSLLAAAEETSHAQAGTLQGSTYDKCVSRSVYIYIYICIILFFFLSTCALKMAHSLVGGLGGSPSAAERGFLAGS